ncbi:helix-turn-helix domain-containing protein [Haloechinothrix sp. YIM 98757]|uniref:Helix-turn-helix domain-containing protein n=1 Tax=Haloechinothrix aidingensis TaxID=2752311 RepID=A0A838AGM8_9PSEU|nr:helix-turn-helix transcriptional regulator [Haloechinothrix aidingensis]MBA0128305.1 helix-turn-helix domain-containing protein [Haloechinothrix aidingensis]
MAEQARPTVRSRQVSGELRRLRKKAGLTSGEVGARLGVSQSKISRIETGAVGLRVEEIAAMLGLYHVPVTEREEILDLAREAANPGWVQARGPRLPDQWQALIEFERTATALWNYEPLWVPGLLQTSDYARAIIDGTAAQERTESELDTKVAARLGRQGILSRALPPELHVLLYEPALRVPVGGAAVMAGQLRYLLEVARRPRVNVRVVPVRVGPHPGLEGPFMIMGFDAEATLVYLENRVQSIFLEEEPHIASYRLAWDGIAARALPPNLSAELITRLAAEWSRLSEE